MKKRLISGVAVLLAAMLALTFSACSGEKDTSSLSSSSAVSQTSFASVEEYVNSQEFQDELKGTNEELEAENIQFSVEAKDNKMLLTMVCSDLGAADDVGVKESAEILIDAMDSVFQEMADALASDVNQDNVGLTVSFADKDGAEILSREYSPKAE